MKTYNILIASGLFLVVLLSCSTSVYAGMQNSEIEHFKVLLKAKSFKPSVGIESSLKSKLNYSKKVPVLIQFQYTPSVTEKKEINQMGIELLNYIPHDTWLARLPTNKIVDISKEPYIRWIGELKAEYKLSAALRNGTPHNWALNEDGSINIAVKFLNGVTYEDSKKIILSNNGLIKNGPGLINNYRIIIDNKSVIILAQNENVEWIEEIPSKPTYSIDESIQTGGVSAVQEAPYKLTGKKVNVGIWDDNKTDETHDDFSTNRVRIVESSATPTIHATLVAGIIGGSGFLSQAKGGTPYQWKGVATSVIMYSYSAEGNPTNELNKSIKERDIDVAQNSWGYDSILGDYTIESVEYDQIIIAAFKGHNGTKIPVVFAVGNSGTPGASGFFKIHSPGATAKNTISVGSIYSDNLSFSNFSSKGPTNDGRLKPDLVAPGCQSGGDKGIKSTGLYDTYTVGCGTSFAAPFVTGVIALMAQQHNCVARNDTLTGTGSLLPSTYKALLLHTATDLNNTGPDYTTGFGLANATKAIDYLNYQYFKQDTVKSQGEIKRYNFTVINENETRVTLVWDDANTTPLAELTLVNDLDLVLIAPNGTKYYPWKLDSSSLGTASLPATRAIDNSSGADHVNNVEQVVVDNPINGTWTIQVNATTLITDQNFSLVYKKPFEMKLAMGWNFISLPVWSYETNISDVFSSLNGKANIIYTLEPSSPDSLRVYIMTDWVGSSLQWVNKTDQNAFRGYMINVTQNDAVLVVQGEPILKKQSNITLLGGLNYVGYTSFIEQEVGSSTSNISGLIGVNRFDFVGGKFVWRNYFPLLSGKVSERFNVKPGYGFVINITPGTLVQNWTINPQKSCPDFAERVSLSGLANYSTDERPLEAFILYGFANASRFLNESDAGAVLSLKVGTSEVTNYSMNELASDKYMLRVPLGAGVSSGANAEIRLCGNIINEGNITIGGEGETRYFNISINATTDSDSDGVVAECSLDCNDTNANVNPNVAEVCGDGIDNNCNGGVDEISVCGRSLAITNLSNIYSNSTQKIYEFIIQNDGNATLTNISWQLNMGDGDIINSSINSTLTSGENLTVYAYYNYGMVDNYTVISIASSGNISSNMSLSSTDIIIGGISVLNISGNKRIFGFDITNSLNANLSHVFWIFDTNNGQVINATTNISAQSNEKIFVMVEYNFTTAGVYNINVSAKNSTMRDWQNMSITIN